MQVIFSNPCKQYRPRCHCRDPNVGRILAEFLERWWGAVVAVVSFSLRCASTSGIVSVHTNKSSPSVTVAVAITLVYSKKFWKISPEILEYMWGLGKRLWVAWTTSSIDQLEYWSERQLAHTKQSVYMPPKRQLQQVAPTKTVLLFNYYYSISFRLFDIPSLQFPSTRKMLEYFFWIKASLLSGTRLRWFYRSPGLWALPREFLPERDGKSTLLALKRELCGNQRSPPRQHPRQDIISYYF